MLDYLKQSSSVKEFYNEFPTIDAFENQIHLKKKSTINRAVLVTVLKKQYANLKPDEKVIQNIDLLSDNQTYTITTGHQLNLFTGPLYFLYKIISTINLCEQLSARYPKNNFVPVYWMATEDHDFEEINHFNFKGQKIVWESEQKGAVGRFATKNFDAVFDFFSEKLNSSDNAKQLKKLFFDAYQKHTNLADATRYLVNELFGTYGLVILDADNKDLKNLFSSYVKDELIQQTSYNQVSKTVKRLSENYKIQVNPREINLFYLKDGLRERIIFDGQSYQINNTRIRFSQQEILEELEKYPERFSPNVIMRPLYQEIILPNLAYIGGGGELAYWLELKDYFNSVGVVFPILILRNSVQLITEKQLKKLDKLSISLKEIFTKQEELINKKVLEKSENAIDFDNQKQFLKQQFEDLLKVAEKTDKSFIGAVKAQQKKQLKGLENLEKRLLRAEKRKQIELVHQIKEIQNSIFPNQSLEERQRNFSEYAESYGLDTIIFNLKKRLNPLDFQFVMAVIH